MAHIVVTTAGTLGGFVPFLALARALRARGHGVSLAVNPAMVPLAERAGLPALQCGHRFGPEDARRHADVYESPLALTAGEFREHLRRLGLGRVFRDLLAACRGADHRGRDRWGQQS